MMVCLYQPVQREGEGDGLGKRSGDVAMALLLSGRLNRAIKHG